MSAHEHPSVPEGARRCQGVLASMGAHGRSLATSGDQWRRSSVHAHTSVHASGRPCAPMSAHERPLVPEGDRRCQGVLASMGAHGRSLATRGDQWRRSSVRWALIRRYTPAVTQERPGAPMSAHRYQRVPEGARGFWLQWAHTGAHWQPVVTSGAAPRHTHSVYHGSEH